MSNENVDTKAWLTLLILSVVWGSSFILMKKALISFPPMQLAALRIAISGITLSPILYKYRGEINWAHWYRYALVGMVGNAIPAVLFFVAQTQISSSLSGLLNSMTPIWTLILGMVFFYQPLIREQVLGVVLGFVGASILVLAGSNMGSSSNAWYGLLVLIATVFYGLSGNLVKHYFQHTRSLLISAGSFGATAIVAILYLLIFNPIHITHWDTSVYQSLGALFVLSLVGTVLATIIFYQLIQRTSAVFGSTVAYIMPIVAITWGVLDGEQVGWLHLLGIVLILVGVYEVRRKNKSSKAAQ